MSSRKSRLTWKPLTTNSTFADMWSIYAEDPNWAKNVISIANKYFWWNYSMNTKLSDIKLSKIAPAIFRQEWFTWKITS